MRSLVGQTFTIFPTIAEASEVAENLQREDGNWTYKVKTDAEGSGLSVVAVYDETGYYMGNL